MGCPRSRDQALQVRIWSLGCFPARCCCPLSSSEIDPFWFMDTVLALSLDTALAFHCTPSQKRGNSPHKFCSSPPIPLPVGSCARAGWSVLLSSQVPNPSYAAVAGPSARQLHTMQR